MNKNIHSHEYATSNPVLEPKTQAFLDSIKESTPIYDLSINNARRGFVTDQAGYAKLPADIEDRTIPVGPKGEVSIRIVRPKGCEEVLPVVVYFHGGGWVIGDRETHDRLIREIA